MGLFKEEISYRDVFPEMTIKTAGLRLNKEKPNGWRKAIDNYMVEKFPSLAESMSSVNFKNINESEGDAVGEIIYSRGVKAIVPIIIEDFQLKDVDLAIVKNRVVPFSEEYMGMLAEGALSIGEEVEKDKRLSDGMSFISSIFDDTEYDWEGNPMGYKMAMMKPETLEKVRSVFDEISWNVPIAQTLKTAEAVNFRDKLLDIVAEEDPDNIYHYSGMTLSKTASGELKTDVIYVDGVELAKLQSSLQKTASDLMGDAREPGVDALEIKPIDLSSREVEVKKATKTGIYKKMFGNNTVDGVFVNINPPSLIPGTPATKSYAVGNILGHGGEGNKDAIQFWVNGDIFVSGKADIDLSPWKGARVDKDNTVDLIGRYIVFNINGSYSEPYLVERAENPHIMDEVSSKRLLLDVQNLDGKEVRLWVLPEIKEVAKVNKENMIKNGYAHEAGYNGDIYAVPGSYTIISLPSQKRNPITPEEIASTLTKEASDEDTKTFSIKDLHSEIYSVNIDGDVSYLTKTAALLYARHYIDDSILSLDEIETKGQPYLYKEASHVNPALSILDKNRGEWIKLASILDRNRAMLEKVADMDSMVSQLVGIDLLDDSSNIDTEEFLSQLTDMIDRVGQLLILARAARIDLSEYALTKAFKALSQLVTDIRG